MASLFDLGFLELITPLVTVVFVFAIVYGILQKSSVIEDKRITAIIAIVAGFFTLLSATVQNLIEATIPVLVIIGIFFLVLLVLANFIGIKTETVIESLGGGAAIWYILVPLIIIVFTVGLGDLGSTDSNSILGIIRNPKILGFALLILIGVFSITFLATSPKK